MRVAIDVTPLAGVATGVARFVEQLVTALAALPDGRAPELVRYARTRRGLLPAGVVRQAIPATVAVRTWRWVGWPSGGRALAAADVTHGTNFVAPPARRPTVLTIHDCSFVTHPERCTPTVRAFGPAVRRAVARGAWLHTPSEYVAGQARELFGTDRVAAILHGPPPPAPTAGAGREPDPVILAVGTEEPRKNLPALIRAFAAVAAADPDVHLVLAGRPDLDTPAIDAALAALPPAVRARVDRRGYVDDAELARLLAAAAVLAYPSFDEGFGLPMLEAQAAGVPVVAARAGSLPEVAGDAAVLIDPRDEDALADGLTRALHDGALRAQLRRAGTANLARFSWARTAEAMMALYRRAREG